MFKRLLQLYFSGFLIGSVAFSFVDILLYLSYETHYITLITYCHCPFVSGAAKI